MAISSSDIELFYKQPHTFGHYLGYEKLIPMHGEWIKRAYTDKTFKAMQAHRGSYKTTAVIIVGSLWWLLFNNRNSTIGTFRKSDTEAKKICKTIREHCESKELRYISKFLYHIDNLKTDNWSNASITLSIKKKKTPEGSFEARGKSSSIVGSHYDIVLPDDIITLKDRISRAERESTYQIIQELYKNIVNPDGFVFFSGTPWHKNDGWDMIEKMGIDIHRYPIGSINLPHITPEYMHNLKKGTQLSLYAANYELKHIADEGRMFGEPTFGKWPEKAKKITAWLDPAYSGDNNTALVIYAHGVDNKHYLTGYSWRDHVSGKYSEIVRILTEMNVGSLYVDSTADKGYSSRDLANMRPLVIPKTEKENKHIKIDHNLKKNFDNIIFDEDCQEQFLENLIEYQEGQEPDDEADAAACILREMGVGIKTDMVFIDYGNRETDKMDF